MKIKWAHVREDDVRIITKDDWSAVPEDRGGPFSHSTTVWDRTNDFTNDVPAKLGQFLLEYEERFSEAE